MKSAIKNSTQTGVSAPYNVPLHPATRTIAQIREHYEVEKKLAMRLATATKEERNRLYAQVYDELFTAVPDHPLLTQKANAQARSRDIAEQICLLQPFLNHDIVFLEIGAGDCALSFAIAAQVRKVYAIEVSKEISTMMSAPANFELILSDGASISVPPNSVHVAYSNQVMEHLHPDDAVEQLHNICRALIPGGVYVCITPHRFTGPHDVSKYFDEIATGFHLKEYTNAELAALYKQAGFAKIETLLGWRKKFFIAPLPPLVKMENWLRVTPVTWRKRICRTRVVHQILGIRLIATR